MKRLVLVMFLLACQPAFVFASDYNFNGLTPGLLVGQDGWTAFVSGDANVVAGTGVNPSQVIAPSDVNINSFLARTNDANYTFTPLSNTTTDQVFEFDFRGTNLDDGGYDRAVLNFGGPGLPNFGIDGIGPVNELFYIRGENAIEYGEPIAGAVGNGDWVRLRLTVNFPAGTGSFSYKNLTTGAATYTPVASLQDINLGITTDPAAWDRMTMIMYQAGADQVFVDNFGVGPLPPLPPVGMPDVNMDGVVNIFDINLVSSNWNTAGPAGDANKDGIVNIFDINLISSNWTPAPAQPVPEPATAVLLVVGAALLVFARRRR